MTAHHDPAPWRLIFLSYPCPKCGARPGQECRTVHGYRANPPHVARTRNSNRCPKCGTLLDADADPGSLCAKHALIRALEVERSTHWQRQEP